MSEEFVNPMAGKTAEEKKEFIVGKAMEIIMNSGDARNFAAQAMNAITKGNFDEAVACFKRALTLDKENYLLWFNLALTYRDAGYIDKAISSMEKAHIMNPEDPEILETLANLCKEYQEKVQETEATINKWTHEIHPNYLSPGMKYADGTNRAPQPVPVHIVAYSGSVLSNQIDNFLRNVWPLKK